MTGDKILFRNLQWKKRGVAAFNDNICSHIMGMCNVDKNDSNLIADVLLVKGLQNNLLNIS